MKHEKLKLISVILLCLGLTGLQAQESIPAAGGVALGSGGTVCYSAGQLLYTTNTGSNGSVANGVIQPYEISVYIDEAEGIILTCNAFPNPTSDLLTLKVENYQDLNLSYHLFDMTGILLETRKLTGKETIITMSNYVSATYFLTVTDNNKVLKSFKLIKN